MDKALQNCRGKCIIWLWKPEEMSVNTLTEEVIACFICKSILGTNQLINTLLNHYLHYAKLSQNHMKQKLLLLFGNWKAQESLYTTKKSSR